LNIRHRLSSIACGISLLTACAVGPDYHRPKFETTETFKETGGWKPSEPNDVLSRGPWWNIYGDDELGKLEAQIDISNENVKSALAAFDQAQALVAQARAGFWPTIAGSIGPQRGAIGDAPARTTVVGALSANWTLDIWGQIRRTVESDRASAQATTSNCARRISCSGSWTTSSSPNNCP
jgi:outer membrane protein TolC